MTIEIHQPELEALIRDRMAAGNFASIEDFLRHALEAESPIAPEVEDTPFRSGAELVAAMQRMPYKDVDLEPERYAMPVSDPVSFA